MQLYYKIYIFFKSKKGEKHYEGEANKYFLKIVYITTRVRVCFMLWVQKFLELNNKIHFLVFLNFVCITFIFILQYCL